MGLFFLYDSDKENTQSPAKRKMLLKHIIRMQG